MLLRDLMREHGKFLFRWRSYLPFVLTPLAITAIYQAGSFEHWFSRPVKFAFEMACLGVALSGLLLRGMTVGYVPAGTSGRNTKQQNAAVLNTTGLYSVTRNPLYLGNFLVLLGIVLAIKVWWLVVIVTAAFALYYERIICAEESFLEERFGAACTHWAQRTPCFIPNFRLWRPPGLPFSFRTALRREFHGLYLIVAAFTLLELGHDTLAEGGMLAGWADEGLPWIAFFVCGSAIYLSRDRRSLGRASARRLGVAMDRALPSGQVE